MARPVYMGIQSQEFANGDSYCGTWTQHGVLDGEGKYTWRAGCFYEGSWKDGTQHGVGKYTWVSGSTYLGEWHLGCLQGVGSLEGADGAARYQGGWHRDAKQGLGRQVYSNGDVYEGLWRLGQPEGPGRYVYGCGNEYDGEWRSGRMHGQGTFVWHGGERYDGEWKEGRMHGIGMLTTADESTYEGRWRRGRKHGVGMYRPGPGAAAAAAAAAVTVAAAVAASTAFAAASICGDGSSFASPHSIEPPPPPGGSNTVTSRPLSGGDISSDGGGRHTRSTAGTMVSTHQHPYPHQHQHPHHQHPHPHLPQRSASPQPGAAPSSHPLFLSPATSVAPSPLASPRNGTPNRLFPTDTTTTAAGADPTAGSTPTPTPMTSTTVSQKAVRLPFARRSGTGSCSGLAAGMVGGGPAAAAGSGLNPPSATTTTTAAAAAAAGKQVFVRVYDKGRIVRETVLSAEELDGVVPRGALAGRIRGMEEWSPAPLLRLLRGGAFAAVGAARPWGPRLGDTVTRAHRAYSLMVALQLGIRYSAGRISHEPLPRHPSRDEFSLRVHQEFPRGGSEMTPVHPGADFTWTDYAPMTFRRLREAFGVDASSYMLSLCSEPSLRHLPSPGKSGSMFFLSQDERFFVKTLSRPELSALLELLPTYTAHVTAQPNTLLCRFLGLHAVTSTAGRKHRFVVMCNALGTPLPLHAKYDLKGSTLGRTARSRTPTPPHTRGNSVVGSADSSSSRMASPARSSTWAAGRVSRVAGSSASVSSSRGASPARAVAGGGGFMVRQGGNMNVSVAGSVTAGSICGSGAAGGDSGGGGSDGVLGSEASVLGEDMGGLILKDLDLDVRLRLEPGWRDQLLSQLRSDVALLAAARVMDYSLLLGVHRRGVDGEGSQGPAEPSTRLSGRTEGGEAAAVAKAAGGQPPQRFGSLTEPSQRHHHLQHPRLHNHFHPPDPKDNNDISVASGKLSRQQEERLGRLQMQLGEQASQDLQELLAMRMQAPGGQGSRGAAVSPVGSDAISLGALGGGAVRLGANMPATLVYKDGREEPALLWFGLIDILQPYNAAKRIEHRLKSVLHPPASISVTHPNMYAQRLLNFISQVFE